MLTTKESALAHIKSNPQCDAVVLCTWLRIKITILTEILKELKKENRIKEVRGQLMVI